MIIEAPENQTNDLGLTLGFEVPNLKGANIPNKNILQGQYCRCEPLGLEKHSPQLFEAYKTDLEDRVWVYLPYGPFETLDQYQQWMQQTCFNGDPYFYAIIDLETNKPTGVASYLRIKPDAGSIEVGHINYSPLLQNTRAATETMYLMMKNAFELGYRRYEWKCNALNAKSCNAAKRLGFTYEGTFRQMMVVKGQNRDSAWFSILDREWIYVRQAYETWLAAENFGEDGEQIQALSALTKSALS